MEIENKQETAPQTRDERIQELLDQSAQGTIKGPSLSDLVTDETKKDFAGETKPETDDTEAIADVEPDEEKESKVRIPRSRLKTLTSKVNELEQQLQASQTMAERLASLEEELRRTRSGDEQLPDWWVEAYGDSDASRQGYKNQLRVAQEMTERAIQAKEAERQAEEAQRQAQIEEIENSFDEQMDELEETLGRSLTAAQKAELLDIVGEYSPQQDGQYLAFMPVEKAYEIWSKGQKSNPAKQAMAEVAGMQSQGGTNTPSPERPQWGDWRKRFGG